MATNGFLAPRPGLEPGTYGLTVRFHPQNQKLYPYLIRASRGFCKKYLTLYLTILTVFKYHSLHGQNCRHPRINSNHH